MAARVSTLWFLGETDARTELSKYPQPDQQRALAMAKQLYPDNDFESLGPHPLSVASTVRPGYLFIGAYDDLSVVCSADLGNHHPSQLPESWLLPSGTGPALLISSIPETAQGSFAVWEGKELRRSFSAIPIDIIENQGIPLTWEREYWAGDHPLRYPPGIMPDPQSLPFHPQQFAEAANLEWLGFRYTGRARPDELDTSQILLWGFKIHRPGEAPPPPVRPASVPATPAADHDHRPPAPEAVATGTAAPKPRRRFARFFGIN